MKMMKTVGTILFVAFLGLSVFSGPRVAQPRLSPQATANGTKTIPQGFCWGNVDFENGVL
jgi:hypothetical protein